MTAVAYPGPSRTLVKRSPVPDGFFPEGIACSLFDDGLLSLIDQAIPEQLGGGKIFTHLLYYATLNPRTTMQPSLFRLTGEAQDEAIVLVRSIHELAKSDHSPCCPESYHKVLLVFEAMQIIRRKLHRHWTEIRIPLGRRTFELPTLLEGVRQMRDHYCNKKFQQFANTVMKRLQSGEFVASAGLSTHAASIPEALRPMAQQLNELLQAYGVPPLRVPSLVEACELLAQAFQSGRIHEKVGESMDTSRKHTCLLVTPHGEFAENEGEFVLTKQRVIDTERHAPLTNSPNLTPKGRIGEREKRRIRPLLPQNQEKNAFFSMDSPTSEEKKANSSQKGESIESVSLNDHISLEISISKQETFNDVSMDTQNLETDVEQPHPKDPQEPIQETTTSYRDKRPIRDIRREAGMYASLFDGPQNKRWMGLWVRLIQTYPPEVRRLAACDTLYHTYFPDWRGKPSRPGGWCVDSCKNFLEHPEDIPSEVVAWARTDYTYREMEALFQRGQHTPSSLVVSERQEISETEEAYTMQSQTSDVSQAIGGQTSDAPTWEEQQQARNHSLIQTRMTKQQAEQLRNTIIEESKANNYGIGVQVISDAQDGYTIVTTWDRAVVEHTTPQAWERYYQGVKTCLELQKKICSPSE